MRHRTHTRTILGGSGKTAIILSRIPHRPPQRARTEQHGETQDIPRFSYGPDSVNEHIPPTKFSNPSITRAISHLATQPTGTRMSVLDISSAFRLLPIRSWHVLLLGYVYAGMFYFEATLPFGLASAPFLYEQLGAALAFIIVSQLALWIQR